MLANTRTLLDGFWPGTVTMTPQVVSGWVENVHGEDDSAALRQSWSFRLQESLNRIERNAIRNDLVRVADLIRGDDTERIRVIVAGERSLPARPSEREGASLSRWSIARLFASAQHSPGWFWDFSDETPQWKPLQNGDDLKKAYVACLRPESAAYDRDLGLRLGEPGNQESPLRTPPPRPGHKPLHAESWLEHATEVAKECRRRFELECSVDSMFARGLEARFGISREQIAILVETAGLLHDMGKLNQEWQRWAEEAQRLADASKLVLLPLAHTDSDRDNAESSGHEVSLRASGIRRPPHAGQSAYLVRAWYDRLLVQLPEQVRAEATSACATAIIAHHGGWLPDDIQLKALTKEWSQVLNRVLNFQTEEAATARVLKLDGKTKSRGVKQLLDMTTHPDKLCQWWPLVAYVTRTLRLSDQRATAEGGS